jgi:hypothetical protein
MIIKNTKRKHKMALSEKRKEEKKRQEIGAHSTRKAQKLFQ